MRKVQEYLDVDIVIDSDGKISDIRKHKSADLRARLVTPALFDTHTHIPFIGSRAFEFLMRTRGKSYIDILAAGGGIHYTAKLVNGASFDELLSIAERHVRKFLQHGVVGIECKSGYGLSVEGELKQLEVINHLKSIVPAKLVSTFLGLHAKPVDGNVESYLKTMQELLLVIRERNLARFVDAFCDKGVYEPSMIEEFVNEAKSLEFELRLHADEIANVGATKFGVKHGARSVDHVLKVTEEDVELLSNSETMAVLMPTTSFYLGETYAPARLMIDKGVAVALGSDFNPGSSPIFQPSFVMHLAIRFLGMEPEEVLTAYTYNGAVLLGFDSGVIAPGFAGDLVLWSTNEFLDIPYMFQENFVEHVLVDGRLVF
ncbi:imidazolonepropionase [Fervidobacterium thailandense]|nr:imidazolonepropionase [Fervidobacterium thailandense]